MKNLIIAILMLISFNAFAIKELNPNVQWSTKSLLTSSVTNKVIYKSNNSKYIQFVISYRSANCNRIKDQFIISNIKQETKKQNLFSISFNEKSPATMRNCENENNKKKLSYHSKEIFKVENDIVIVSPNNLDVKIQEIILHD